MAIDLPQFRELKLERMSRSFGTLHALRDVDLTVRRGEFIALLGPSGCGKSTALNCIAGLLTISGGRVMLDARRIDRLKPEDRGFGMVFQNYALFPHMTVRQNIGFGLRMRSVDRAERDRRVAEGVRLVRLQGHEHKLPGQLSGGQQQRVAIARAVVVEPSLVLMDEPLSNLDAKLRLEMRAEIRRIHNELGATTLYVTHDQDEALSLADRIVVLREGAICQVGTPRELYEEPADLYVAEFMGYRNRIEGMLERLGDGGVAVRVGAELIPARSMSGPASGPAIVAARPEDVTAVPADRPGFTATVDSIEYRGREFVGIAHTREGVQLIFRSALSVQPGSPVRLAIDAERALVFPGAA